MGPPTTEKKRFLPSYEREREKEVGGFPLGQSVVLLGEVGGKKPMAWLRGDQRYSSRGEKGERKGRKGEHLILCHVQR